MDYFRELSPHIKAFIMMMLAFSLNTLNVALGFSICLFHISMTTFMFFFFIYYLIIFNKMPVYIKIIMPIPIVIAGVGFINALFEECF